MELVVSDFQRGTPSASKFSRAVPTTENTQIIFRLSVKLFLSIFIFFGVLAFWDCCFFFIQIKYTKISGAVGDVLDVKEGEGGVGVRACQKCGKAGHIAKDCATEVKSGTGEGCGGGGQDGGGGYVSGNDINGAIVGCCKCGELGHFLRDCPSKSWILDHFGYGEGEFESSYNKPCYRCGKSGHLSRDCYSDDSDEADDEEMYDGATDVDDLYCYKCKKRIHLDISIGEHANDYKEIAARDKLSELQLRVRQLLDQVDQITKEQNYQRVREERFRMTSESTNSRVLWWAFMQTCVLLAIGFWQMRHLKSFFEAKKLV